MMYWGRENKDDWRRDVFVIDQINSKYAAMHNETDLKI